MKLGAEPKKIAVLGGLLCVAGYFYISGRSSEDAPSTPKTAPLESARRFVPSVPSPNIERATPAGRSRRTSSREFRPKLGGDKGGIDPTTLDPTLRLDLLAKVQNVKMEGAARNLFQFGAAPAAKVPEVKVKPAAIAPVIAAAQQPGMQPGAAPAKIPPPPIPLKFYGYVSRNRAADKRAFFLEGEEIFVAGEGETIKQRYKVLRIGINSAVVEDTQFSHEQTLPIEEQAG